MYALVPNQNPSVEDPVSDSLGRQYFVPLGVGGGWENLSVFTGDAVEVLDDDGRIENGLGVRFDEDWYLRDREAAISLRDLDNIPFRPDSRRPLVHSA